MTESDVVTLAYLAIYFVFFVGLPFIGIVDYLETRRWQRECDRYDKR